MKLVYVKTIEERLHELVRTKPFYKKIDKIVLTKAEMVEFAVFLDEQSYYHIHTDSLKKLPREHTTYRFMGYLVEEEKAGA